MIKEANETLTEKILEKTPTGINGLDDITYGGLPKGRPTLVCGSAGSGKTLMAMEFLVKGAKKYDEPGVFMAFEETEEELAKNFASLGFDLNDLEANNKLIVDCNVRGVTMRYNIDCKRSKIDQVNLGNSNLKGNININYSNFIYLNSTLIPRSISVEDLQNNIKVRIKIIKTEYPWNGDVKFVPGKGYEIIEIL